MSRILPVVLASSFLVLPLAFTNCKSAPTADTASSVAPPAASPTPIATASAAPSPSASAPLEAAGATWSSVVAAMAVQPGHRNGITDPGGVACVFEAATSKAALPPDLAWGHCASTIPGCKELEPFAGANVYRAGFDREAPGGPLVGVLLKQNGSSLALFANLDGAVKNAVEVHSGKGKCGGEELAVGGGRYALGINGRMKNSRGDDSFDDFEVDWVATGTDGSIGRTSDTDMPLPAVLGARLATPAGLKIWPGAGSSIDDVNNHIAIVRDAGIGLTRDQQAIQIAKLPSNTVLATSPPGSTFASLGASSDAIVWMEKAADGCVIVTSPFADTAEKLAPKRLGRFPCVRLTTEPMIVGGGYASYETRLVRLSDGQSFDVGKACSTAQCEITVIGITATEVFIRTYTESAPSPNKLLRIPIASLGAGTAAADAGAPPMGDAGAADAGLPSQDAGTPLAAPVDAGSQAVDAGASH